MCQGVACATEQSRLEVNLQESSLSTSFSLLSLSFQTRDNSIHSLEIASTLPHHKSLTRSATVKPVSGASLPGDRKKRRDHSGQSQTRRGGALSRGVGTVSVARAPASSGTKRHTWGPGARRPVTGARDDQTSVFCQLFQTRRPLVARVEPESRRRALG